MINVNARYIVVVMLVYCASSFAETAPKALYSAEGLDRASCKGQIKSDSSLPKIVNFCDCLPERYPQNLIADVSGSLDIEFEVGENNNLINARIVKSSGFKVLDKLAAEAQTKCKFQSAFKDGKPAHANFTMRYLWDNDDHSFSTMGVK